MDDSTGCKVELDDIDEQELKRRYYERLSGWSEPGAVEINRNGKLLRPPSEPSRDSADRLRRL